MKEVNVAIAGATGAVGEALREILEERKFPVGNLHLLASERSEGKRLQFRGKSVKVERLDQFDFSKVQIGLFSAGGDLSAEFAPKAAEAREILSSAPGVTVLDDPGNNGYPTAVTDGAGTDPVFVGRIREDISHPRGLDLWVVSDNVRKGAALNSVQIAELLLNKWV